MHVISSVMRLYQRGLWIVLAALVVVTGVAIMLARTLTLDADLSQLLPESASSVRGLKKLEEQYGGNIGRLTVVLQSPDRELNRRAAWHLSSQLDGLQGVGRVEVVRPREFFLQHRLLYVDLADLEDISQRIHRRLDRERGRANPLFAELGAQNEPQDLDLSDIEERYATLDNGEYYEARDGNTLVFFVYPNFSAADLGKSTTLIEQVREVSKESLSGEFSGIEMSLTGRYMKRVEQEEILSKDLKTATSVAIFLLLSFLGLYLRSLRATILVLVPLVVGTTWGFAWAAIMFGNLNILTTFLGAILLGLGVDYGIHLVSRYYEARSDHERVAQALMTAMQTSGRASMYAGLTTMAALGSLALSSFRAFYEFGVIALGAMLLILLAYGTVLPVMVLVYARLFPESEAAPLGRVPLSVVWADRLAPKLTLGEHPSSRQLNRMRRLFVITLFSLGAIVLLTTIGWSRVQIARDFRAVQMTDTPTWRLDELVNDIIGQSQTPAVVMVDSAAHARAVVEELRNRQKSWPQGYTIQQVLSIDEVLPRDQGAKLALLGELKDELEAVPADERSEQLTGFLHEVEEVLAAGPVSAAMLPQSLQIPFSRRDDARRAIVLVFAAHPAEKAQVIEDFATVMRNLPGADVQQPTIEGVSEALLLADILVYVEHDMVWMVSTALLGVVLVGVLAFGFRRRLWELLGILALSISCAIGVTGLLGLQFTFLNLIIVPVWLGLAVDVSFYMLMRRDETGDEVRPLLGVAGSVIAGFLTSMIGFSALLFAHHQGLFELGLIAVVGLGTILIVNLLIHLLLLVRSQLVQRSIGVDLRAKPEPDMPYLPLTGHE